MLDLIVQPFEFSPIDIVRVGNFLDFCQINSRRRLIKPSTSKLFIKIQETFLLLSSELKLSLWLLRTSLQGPTTTASTTTAATLLTMLSPSISKLGESHTQASCRKFNFLHLTSLQFSNPTVGCCVTSDERLQKLISHSSTRNNFHFEEDLVSPPQEGFRETFSLIIFKKYNAPGTFKILKQSRKPFLSDFLRSEEGLCQLSEILVLVQSQTTYLCVAPVLRKIISH